MTAALTHAALVALAAIFLAAVVAWCASVFLNNVSFVDSLWSLFILTTALVYAAFAPELHARSWLLLVLVAIWAFRLSLYISMRNWGQPEDHRYQKIRTRNQPFVWKSLYVVFGLQGVLAWLISLPLLVAIVVPGDIGVTEIFATLLWLIGFVFEAVGDYQLARFKASPANEGRVLQSGLWRYTRHPNYFGEFCIWWAFYLFALGAGGWWTAWSPLLMSILLLKVSGVALLEKDIAERRPGYTDYVRRTNAFFPARPKPSATAGMAGS
jgi:steroid 5-alpha reductase family enzyme